MPLQHLQSPARPARAQEPALAAAAPGESVQAIVSQLLIAEQLAMTLYYTALTTHAVVSHPYLAGTSGDPRKVASNGNRVNVAGMQAALDQERQHAALLAARGAISPHRHYYFPAATFARLGYTRDVGTFLWVLDHIETALVGAYLAALGQFSQQRSTELAQIAARILGTEAQHRVLGRLVAGDTPSDNLALEVISFGRVRELEAVLRPYVTGQGLPGGATRAIPVPSSAAMLGASGAYRSR